MLWIQQKERDKIIQVSPIPTDLNSADIGAKNLPKKRLRGLLYMMGVIDAVGDRVGEEEFHEIDKEYQMKMSRKKFNKSKDLRIGLCMHWGLEPVHVAAQLHECSDQVRWGLHAAPREGHESDEEGLHECRDGSERQ